jgi:hypothetical protein
LSDYDFIGFDVHAIIKYNVDELLKFLVQCHLKDLANMHYPQEVLNFDYNQNMGHCINNVVWDITTGNILKIAEGYEIARAVHGYKVLSREEIK